jgi:hypothetical protein
VQISPKLSYWLNVALGGMLAVYIGVVKLTDFSFVTATTAHDIVTACGLGAFFLNMVLHGYSTSSPGPGMPPVLAPPAVPTTWKCRDAPPPVPEP